MRPQVKRLHDQVYLVTCKDPVDLSMLFLTYQEFYESPSPKFRNNPNFDILKFIEWYSKDHCHNFTYPTDWSGFNVPSHVFDAVRSENRYTKKFKNLIKKRIKPFLPSKDARFYILGALGDDTKTLDHEMAHAMYYIDPAYKSKADCWLAVYDNVYQDLKKVLISIGYAEEVCLDEAQAYLSTGTVEDIDKFFDENKTEGVKDCIAELEKNFQTFKQMIFKE